MGSQLLIVGACQCGIFCDGIPIGYSSIDGVMSGLLPLYRIELDDDFDSGVIRDDSAVDDSTIPDPVKERGGSTEYIKHVV